MNLKKALALQAVIFALAGNMLGVTVMALWLERGLWSLMLSVSITLLFLGVGVLVFNTMRG